MRNSVVLSILLGLLAVAQADTLDSHVRLNFGKIQSVLPRNEDGNKNGKASKPKIDAQELAATSAIDTGEPCEHQTTVIVTETAAGAAAAVVTGLNSGSSQNKTVRDTKNNNKNQDQNDNDRTGNKNKGSQNGQEKDQGNVVQILTVDISGNNGNNDAHAQGNDKTVTVHSQGNDKTVTGTKTQVIGNGKANGNNNAHAQGNDKTVTVHAQGNDKTVTGTKTQVIGNGKANGNENQSQAVQLSFVTETVFGAGNAPTVTITPIAQIVTQHVTITEKGGAAEAVTVTMQAPPVTITQQAAAAAVVAPSTVTVTEPGVCTTTNGLAAASPVAIAQPSAAIVAAEAAPSPVSTGAGNGMGILDANGVCRSCHCLCNAQDFLSASVQIAAPVVGANAAASAMTTLQTVVTVAAQAPSTNAVAQADAGIPFQPGADTAVAAAQSDTALSQVAQGAALSKPDAATTTDVSSQSTVIAVVDTATQDAAATTAAQPSISESAADVFAENAQSPTATTDAGAESTTATGTNSAVTLAPPVPGALAVNNGGGPPRPIDINTYTLASAIALGHLRRR
ncbi:hypothetical protein VC83_06426 [Pseudogymnoascus destructans]|uniref:Uncharacterized protein n=2 Tax=Pseudogymnoascus destructans TaxID=655981 RepID=L8FZB7_PSED2|nr:uncharacterized protein VC83_06426 [Pseudogymnoascus destructans]ELR05879.1 hypothetical protein GMDG_07652 [Pseudogymnoascus destructans 20631-21]OAF58275.1 hypothetical protein VC83_06426 [Pseudogymnoascus destructans]